MEKTTKIVNELIRVLEDGKEGFAKAAEGIKDAELKSLFGRYSAERDAMIQDLRGTSVFIEEENRATLAGALHRGWIGLKAALTAGDDHAILAECERGEDHGVHAYKDAMGEPLPQQVNALINTQYGQIKAVHDKVKSLRETARTGA